MTLQIIYFGLGIYGWFEWLHGGRNRSRLAISRITTTECITLILALPICTILLRVVLVKVNGAAPFWDSLTTVLSLVAQYLLCRKRLENWFIWIIADIIYVPLYLSRKLPLTAILYGVFLSMCIIGLRQWSRQCQRSNNL
jgi:nicotinamide mononucleotide transporter